TRSIASKVLEKQNCLQMSQAFSEFALILTRRRCIQKWLVCQGSSRVMSAFGRVRSPSGPELQGHASQNAVACRPVARGSPGTVGSNARGAGEGRCSQRPSVETMRNDYLPLGAPCKILR